MMTDLRGIVGDGKKKVSVCSRVGRKIGGLAKRCRGIGQKLQCEDRLVKIASWCVGCRMKRGKNGKEMRRGGAAGSL